MAVEDLRALFRESGLAARLFGVTWRWSRYQLMTALWVLWVFYVFAFVTDLLYVQPYRRRKAHEHGESYESGSLSFGLRASLPVVTLVLVARTFVVDIYHIPTQSMVPALEEGSTIWVNRLAYGVRSPITGTPLLGNTSPAAGDIVVFKYPREPRTTYVKRVIGTPGDRIEIQGDRIAINGTVLHRPSGGPPITTVQLGSVTYQMLDDPLVTFDGELDLRVPEGHYFAMGDNINNSEDSRTWGFVADTHLIGRVGKK